MNIRKGLAVAAIAATLGLATSAPAGSHGWRFNEIFSNADGTIQFIELKECCGSTAEWGLNNKWVRSGDLANQFNFPANISGNTANRHLLLATAGRCEWLRVQWPDLPTLDPGERGAVE